MTDPNEVLIRAENVTKKYRGKLVLDIQDFPISRGECMFLWGANASGKSSLLRLLFGLSKPSSGTCTFSEGFMDRCRLFLPQSDGLYPDLSMQQNLLLLARLNNRAPLQQPIDDLLGDEVDAVMASPLRTLSGGMRRVATIACLLSLRPGILFLDEPFGGLDTERRSLVTQALARGANHMDLLVVTGHDPSDAPEDWRSIKLTNGRLETKT